MVRISNGRYWHKIQSEYRQRFGIRMPTVQPFSAGILHCGLRVRMYVFKLFFQCFGSINTHFLLITETIHSRRERGHRA